MTSCRKAADLIHKKHNVGLTRSERVKLQVHTQMCAACKTLEKQTGQIEQVIKNRLSEDNSPDLGELKSETTSKLMRQ